jgi:xylulokinase
MSLLGIDVGTSGCKAALFSAGGELLAVAYTEYDMAHPQPGYAELDALQVWATVKRLIAQAAAEAGRDPVQALAVSSMGEAVVPVTLARQVLAPSIINFDRRGEEFLLALRARIPAERLYRINGNTLGNNYSLTKLIWLQRYQPEVYARADVFLHWSGFIAFMLGAEPAVDYSLANRTLLFDLDQAGWSDELIALAGLDRAKLPRPVAPGTLLGQVSAGVARELGLPPGVSISAGVHDQNANALGCGVTAEGQAVYGMGTFTCITPVFNQRIDPALMLARGLNTEHHAVAGRYVSFLYNQGGALLKWYRDTFAPLEKRQAAAEGRDIYAELIREIPRGPSEVLVLPHFMQTGPPEFISASSGVMLGLKLETTRGEILKGILEGSVYYLKECVDTLPAVGISIRDFRATGGGSKSDAWVQLSADIFGIPIVRPQFTEAGALGAAILAGAGSGVFASLEQGVAAMVRLERTFEPDSAQHAHYARRFEQYRQIWPLMKDFLLSESTESHP